MSRRRFTTLAVAALITAGAALTAVATPAPSGAIAVGEPNPNGCSLQATDGTVTRQLGERTYTLHVPAGLAAQPVPLLLSLHGWGEPSPYHENETGWPAFAAEHHFIVAYPDGIERHWDFNAGSTDVGFLKAVVDDIAGTWCVDRKRVHAEGYSNGAMMVGRLACDAPDVFASVAAYAGASPEALGGGPCQPSRPISVGIFQSAFDPVSSYLVGTANRDEWVKRNGCPADGATEPGVMAEAARYRPCQGGTEVVWRLYGPQSHNWPTGDDRADIAERMWALFERNPLP